MQDWRAGQLWYLVHFDDCGSGMRLRPEALDIGVELAEGADRCRVTRSSSPRMSGRSDTELSANGNADQVEARLREALDAHGLQLFARIDHAAGARKADVELEANVLLIVRQPERRHPLMRADPRVGIELPLRMLIWQDPDGTHVGYLDARALADRYALDGHQQTLERQTAVLTALAAAAAG
jgi:uncharacterized protein (DUF302 family)